MAPWKKLFLEQTVAQWFFQLRLLVLFLFVEVKHDLGNKNYHMIQVNQTTSPTLSDRITSLRGDHTVKSVVCDVDWRSLMSAIPVSSDPPQHIPQVPALERSSVAAMVPGIWGLAIWGQRIDLAVHVQWITMAACRTWIILEQRNIFFNKQLFLLSCPHLGFQSIDDNRESLWQELIFRKDFYS